MAASTITIGDAKASSANSNVVMSPHVVEYSPPFTNVNGKFIALGAVVAAYVKMKNNVPDETLSNAATTAENAWNTDLENLRLYATTAPSRILHVYDPSAPANSDSEESSSVVVNSLLSKMNEFAVCGYITDYTQVRRDALGSKNVITAKKMVGKELESLPRYRVGVLNQGYLNAEIQLAEDRARDVVTLREQARIKEFPQNYSLLTKALLNNDKASLEVKGLTSDYLTEYLKVRAGMMQAQSWLSTTKRAAAAKKGNDDSSTDASNIQALFVLVTLIATLTTTKALWVTEC